MYIVYSTISPKSNAILYEREGDDPNTAALRAATEMRGADVDRFGNANAQQMACPILDYDEACPPSPGADDGRKATAEAMEVFQEEHNLILQVGEDLADAWLRLKTPADES